MHIAVVGAGIVGAAAARALAGRNTRVTILEAHTPGYGTSSTTFGWVNSHDKRPDSYHRLNVAGCEEHRRLAEQPAATPRWYFRVGNVEWAEDPDDAKLLEERTNHLQELGYPSRWADPAEIAAALPDVRVPGRVRRIAVFPEEGYVLPSLLLARLLGEAQDHGARLRTEAAVERLEPAPDGVRLWFADGSTERFDKVVCCVGRWTESLAAESGASVPLVDPDQAGGAAVGFLAYTTPLPVRIDRLLTTPRINLRPDGGGRLVLQGLDLDAGADPADPPRTDGAAAATLAKRLAEIVNVPLRAEIQSVRVGQRALPADGLTVAGHLPGFDERVYVVATHSGITLGPLLGRLVGDEVAGDTTSPLLADFRPDRFTSGSTATAQPARRLGEQ